MEIILALGWIVAVILGIKVQRLSKRNREQRWLINELFVHYKEWYSVHHFNILTKELQK
jgi:hypothetical protein